MPRELFVERRFSRGSTKMIEQANAIIAEYQEMGFALTLRQLYYQFVARGLIENKQTEYKRLGSVINDARLAGLIDWHAIEDRTRYLRRVNTWASPNSIIASAASSYARNLWEGQPNRVEVWIEKDALVGVVEPVCRELHVPYYACRGYSSQSEQYRAGKRFVGYREGEGHERVVVLHLGDHDPSGIDMTRDNDLRLGMFADGFEDGHPEWLEVHRVALNMDQVEQYNPPPNPAKETDSRSPDYIKRFGESSWELDALSPDVIDALIRGRVLGLIADRERWEQNVRLMAEEKAALRKVADLEDASAIPDLVAAVRRELDGRVDGDAERLRSILRRVAG